MQIASALGGFSMGQADTLRKAMGKKKTDIMRQMKVKFVAGAVARGYDEQVAREIFEEMEFFAAVRLQQEPLGGLRAAVAADRLAEGAPPGRVHGRDHDLGDAQERAHHAADRRVQGLGLTIVPPDINRPRAEFSVRDGRDRVRAGRGARAWGRRRSTSVRRREELGRDFTDLFDLCGHVDLQKVNRKVLEGLIHAGAWTGCPATARRCVANLDRAIASGQKAARDRAGGQASLFGGAAQRRELKPPLHARREPFDPLVQLSLEREAVGFYLSRPPVPGVRRADRRRCRWSPCAARRHAGEGTWVDLVGVVTSHTKARDKHKRVYARAHFEDRDGDDLGWSSTPASTRRRGRWWRATSMQVVSGRVQVRSDGEREIVVDRLTRIDEVLGTWVKDVFLRSTSRQPGGPASRAWAPCSPPAASRRR